MGAWRVDWSRKDTTKAKNVYMLYNTWNYLGSALMNNNCGIFNLVKTFPNGVLYFKTKTQICLFALDFNVLEILYFSQNA